MKRVRKSVRAIRRSIADFCCTVEEIVLVFTTLTMAFATLVALQRATFEKLSPATSDRGSEQTDGGVRRDAPAGSSEANERSEREDSGGHETFEANACRCQPCDQAQTRCLAKTQNARRARERSHISPARCGVAPQREPVPPRAGR